MNTVTLPNPNPPSMNPPLQLPVEFEAHSPEAKSPTPDLSSAMATPPEAPADSALLEMVPPKVPPGPFPPPPPKLDIGAMGTVEELLPEENTALMANEQVIREEFGGSIQVGLALVDIRDRRLYRIDYDSFPQYYQSKWHFERRRVCFLTAIAEVHRSIINAKDLPKPEYDFQMRPLLGATPDQVRLAWELAAKKAGSGKITPRLVRAAVAELKIKPEADQETSQSRQERAERRQQLRQTMADLLEGIVMHKPYEELVQKASLLDGHVRFFFPKRPKRG